MVASAASLGIPETFNAAAYFIDRHVAEGRGGSVAIECGDARITYADVFENVNRFASLLRRRLDVRPEERVLLLLFDGPAFVYSFFGAIKAGAVPVPLNTLWKPADYAYVVRDANASVLIASPELAPRLDDMPADARRKLRHVVTSLDNLLAHAGARPDGDFDLSSVRLAVSAVEALPAALYERFKQRFGVDIIDRIGSTEVGHMFISNRPGAIRPGSSGLVVDGYEARILDDNRVPVGANQIGNLWLRGDSICACYWNQHEKTKDTIEGHWIRTGDKYTQDEEGFFWYAGRSDDMLKVGGLWVSPIEVENALVAHPAVLECGVVGRGDRDALTKPMAFVVLREGAAQSQELARDLQQFVRERLAEYKR